MSRAGKLVASSMVALGLVAVLPVSASAVTSTGNAGTQSPNGDVTASPRGGDYFYVSTDGGVPGGGQIGGTGGVDGSSWVSSPFSAAAGETLDFYFNFITSDGSDIADYGWAELLDGSSRSLGFLFTARNQQSGVITPGAALPPIAATLTPGTSGINVGTGAQGGPAWQALGADSGKCFREGCGYTGWILSQYQVATAGDYILRVGVANWDDESFDSGVAFDSSKLHDDPTDPGVSPIPLPAALPLLAAALGGLGIATRLRRRSSKA